MWIATRWKWNKLLTNLLNIWNNTFNSNSRWFTLITLNKTFFMLEGVKLVNLWGLNVHNEFTFWVRLNLLLIQQDTCYYKLSDYCPVRCLLVGISITMPEFISNLLCFYSSENPIFGHESRDDYVTVDNIEII